MAEINLAPMLLYPCRQAAGALEAHEPRREDRRDLRVAYKLPTEQPRKRRALLGGEHGHEGGQHIRIGIVFSGMIPNCTGFCTSQLRRFDANG